MESLFFKKRGFVVLVAVVAVFLLSFFGILLVGAPSVSAQTITSLSPSYITTGDRVKPEIRGVPNALATITITGSGFTPESMVYFYGQAFNPTRMIWRRKSATFISSTKLQITPIFGDDLYFATNRRDPYLVKVVTPGTQDVSIELEVRPEPVTRNISPKIARANELLDITVYGDNFKEGYSVYLDSAYRLSTIIAYDSVSGTTVARATVPANLVGDPGNYRSVLLKSPGGGGYEYNGGQAKFYVPYKLNSLDITSVIEGSKDTEIKINGDFNEPYGNLQVEPVAYFNDTEIIAHAISSNESGRVTQISVTLPASSLTRPGTYNISVESRKYASYRISNVGGDNFLGGIEKTGAVSNKLTFTVIPAPPPTPRLTSINPSIGYINSGTFTLTANGSNFTNGSVIWFGGASYATTFMSASKITARIQNLTTTGSYSVKVCNGPVSGQNCSDALSYEVIRPLVNDYVILTPTISSLSPNPVTAGGPGFTLTVDGDGFLGNSVVNIGGSQRNTSYISMNQLTAQLLASDIATAGTASITVTITTGAGPNFQALTSAPHVLTISGTNPPPPPPGTKPFIASMTPDNAIESSGDLAVTIDGTNFGAGDIVTIALPTGQVVQRTPYNLSSSQIKFTMLNTDISRIGTLYVWVARAGNIFSNQVPFIVNALKNTNNPPGTLTPVIESISPSSVSADSSQKNAPSVNKGGPSFRIFVRGMNFINPTSKVKAFCHKVGLEEIIPTTFLSQDQLMAEVSKRCIGEAGTIDIVVLNGTTSSNTRTITVQAVRIDPPIITGLLPSSTTAGNPAFALTIFGRNFDISSQVLIRTNSGQSLRASTFIGPNKLAAQILASDIANQGSFKVIVRNNFSSLSSVPYEFSMVSPGSSSVPIVTSISPGMATVGDAGFVLTIHGTGFSASDVVWTSRRLNLPVFHVTTFVSPEKLTIAIPASSVGDRGSFDIYVITVERFQSNSLTFTVNPSDTTGKETLATVANLPKGTGTISACAGNSLTNKIYCFAPGSSVLEFNPANNVLMKKTAKIPATLAHADCVEDAPSHYIFCFGGAVSAGVGSSAIYRYDPSSDTLILMKAVMPFGVYASTCTQDAASRKIFCLGGTVRSSQNTREIIAYDPAGDSVTSLENKLPWQERYLACAQDPLAYGIFCFGGEYENEENFSTFLDQVIQLNPASRTLSTPVPPSAYPFTATQMSCAYHKLTNSIYCYGGVSRTGNASEVPWAGYTVDYTYYNTITQYNLATKTFTRSSKTLPQARYGAPHSCVDDPSTECQFCFNGINPEGKVLAGIIKYCPKTEAANPDTDQKPPSTPAVCSTHADCGTDGYVGDLFCKADGSYRKWQTFTCKNPGTPLAACQNSTADSLLCFSNAECGGGVAAGSLYCLGNSVYQSGGGGAYCQNPGTTGARCTGPTSIFKKTCISQSCVKGACR